MPIEHTLTHSLSDTLLSVTLTLPNSLLTRPLINTIRSMPIEPPNDGCHPNDLGYAV